MLWLYLYFPSVQLNMLYQQTDEALIIVDNKSNQVVQRNSKAHQSGIELGMGLATAASMCHQLSVIEYDDKQEAVRLKELAATLYHLTSDIALDSPNGIFIRVGNMLALYKRLDNYWHCIQQQLKAEAISYHYAFAYSPWAARLLARELFDQCTDNKHAIEQALAKIPTTKLSVSRKTIDNLQRVGIRHLANLLQLPLKEVGRRFDIELINTLGKITGNLKHGLQFYQPKPRFSKHAELLYEISQADTLVHPIKSLLKTLEQFLQQRELVTQQLDFLFMQRSHSPLSLTVYSAEGYYTAKQWLPLITLKLESVTLNSPATAVTLTVEQLNAKHCIANELFNKHQGHITEKELLSLLHAKLGDNQVFRLTMLNTHIPDEVNLLLDAITPQNTSIEISPLSLRPSYLLNQPIPLECEVELVLGPERIQSAWWQPHHICRDYFIGKNSTGQWCWVFRQPDNQWFLHGYFG